MLTSIVVALLLTQVAPWGTPAVFNPHGQSIAAQDPSGNTAPFHVDASGNLLVSGASGGGGGLTDTQLRASPVPVSGTLGVTGTFWPATQPVSAVALPLPSGAAQDRTTAAAPLSCRLTDGTSFYTAGGSSGLTDAQLRAVAVPVSLASAPTTPVTGTFWQATQPISGTVTATGTFWQATQPVSIATMPSTPVTGTFWQATQPISAASTLPTRSAKVAAAPLATVTNVTTSATQLPASPLANRVSLCVYNLGATTIYLGAAGVTTVAGFPLPAGGAFCDDVGAQLYYGIAASGTVETRVLEN